MTKIQNYKPLNLEPISFLASRQQLGDVQDPDR